MSKLYRLKEEVKKFVNFNEEDKNEKRSLEYWKFCGFNINALDEVKEKLEIKCTYDLTINKTKFVITGSHVQKEKDLKK